MASKRWREYRFKIDAYSPETMPLGRLAEYLHDLVTLFGEDKSVHLIKIEDGSTTPVLLVEREAEPKVRERLLAVRHKQASVPVMRAATEIDKRLRRDNAKGAVVDPVGHKIITFPGRELLKRLQYPPFNQPGTLAQLPRSERLPAAVLSSLLVQVFCFQLR